MPGTEDLSELLKSARKRTEKGQGEAVLKEAASLDKPIASLITAEVKLRMDESAEAKAAAKTAVELFKAKGDIKSQIRAMQVLADARMWCNECAEAIRLCTQAVRLCWKTGDKEGEAAIMHTSAAAYLLTSKYAEAGRAATRAAVLYRAAGDPVGEAMALETAATASLSSSPQEAGKGATEASMLLKELKGPVGGQAEMDTVAMGKPIQYEKRLWTPISKFHPIMRQRENLGRQPKGESKVAGALQKDGKPLFNHRSFSWMTPKHRLDQGWFEQVLVAGDKIC